MDWLDSVKTKKQIESADTPNERISALFDMVADSSIDNSSYEPKVRFSKLPVCPLLFTLELLSTNKKMHFSMSFYTSIGNAVHDTFQIHAPVTENISKYIFGNWKCTKCKEVTAKLCVTPLNLICLKCRSNKPTLKYSELEVSYKGVTGHIDLILLIEDVYYIVDFKTTSAKNILNPEKYLPNNKHLMQIESYVYAIMHQFDIQVSHYALIYVSRDTTDLEEAYVSKNNRWIYGRSTTPEMLALRKKQLEGAVKTKRIVNQFIREPTVKHLRELEEARPCRRKSDYKNNQTGMVNAFIGKDCKYLESCCGQAKWTKASEDIWEIVDND